MVTSVRSAAICAALTVEPATVTVPSTDGVRPTAVADPTLTSTSSMRNPAKEPLPWALVMVRSIVHVPSAAETAGAPAAVVAGAEVPEVAGAAVGAVDSMPASAWSRLTAAGVSWRRTNHHSASPASRTGTATTRASQRQRRPCLGGEGGAWRVIIVAFMPTSSNLTLGGTSPDPGKLLLVTAQVDGDGGPATGSGVEADRPPVGGHDLRDDGEAEAGPPSGG